MSYILVLAFILRIVLINQSLWLDEASEALALMGKSGSLYSYLLADYQPPLYHAISYIFTHLLGFSELVLRLPSLLSGIFTVYFVVKIGELVGSKKIGIIAGLLAATNPLLIYYSQEGRTYALTTFFVTASFYYFIKLLNTKVWSLKSSVLYTLYSILFIWTSYLSWFLLLAEGIYLLWKKRYDLIIFPVLAGFTLLAWLPSFITSLGVGHYTLGLSSAWGRVVGGVTWKSLPLTWVKFVLGRISFTNKILYGSIVSTIGLLHIYTLSHVKYKKNDLLLLWLITPVILGLLTAGVLPVYAYFRVLFVLPAYLLILSLGLDQLHLNCTYFIIASQLIFLAIFWLSPAYHRENWRDLAHNLPTSASVAMPTREQGSGLYYYGIDQSRVIEPMREPITGDKVYYIRYAEDLFDSQKLGQSNLLKSGYTITRELSYPGIQVDIYENRH